VEDTQLFPEDMEQEIFINTLEDESVAQNLMAEDTVGKLENGGSALNKNLTVSDFLRTVSQILSENSEAASANVQKLFGSRAYKSLLQNVMEQQWLIRPEEFTGNFLLESVTIPESVKHIGEHAFANCKNLSEVIISDNVFNIDCGAFSNCESLGEIFIPNSVTNIGADAFYGCKNLNKINISNKVVILEKGVFSGCENLNEITIPYGVINIGDGAFEECKSLREVSIPDSVASIGDYAFWNCQSLNQITVWSNVTSIGYSAFDGCKNLTIRAFKGSYAERYALENEIPFEEI
jgi:hypothetical protein